MIVQCPFLLPLVECEYSKVNGHHLVSMLYPFQEEGSFRDVMYGVRWNVVSTSFLIDNLSTRLNLWMVGRVRSKEEEYV